MAAPKVFVGSTCYDLKYIRENIRYFLRTLGYEPVLSDDGGVFYDPLVHTHEACLFKVPNCQIFILIIGGRYGGKYKDTEKSITNAEYETAMQSKIPVFALIEQSVYAEHHVWLSNRKNKDVDVSKINYPAVDNTKVFDFIEQVRRASYNNAIVPFRDYSDIEEYLKKQWAGMMFNFLTQQSEAERVADTLKELTSVNQKLEFLTRELLSQVGDEFSQITVSLYDLMLNHSIARDIGIWDIHISPHEVITHETLDDLANHDISPYESEEYEISIANGGPPYRASPAKIEQMREEYIDLRQQLLNFLENNKTTKEKYVADSNRREHLPVTAEQRPLRHGAGKNSLK